MRKKALSMIITCKTLNATERIKTNKKTVHRLPLCRLQNLKSNASEDKTINEKIIKPRNKIKNSKYIAQ